MLNSKTVGIALAAAVAVIGTLLILQAEEPAASQIHLSTDHVGITPPGEVRGVASTTPEGDVEVCAEIDGVPIEGFPDDDQTGPVNDFLIPVTPAMSGKTIVITATAADGSRKKTYVQVH